MSAKNGKPKGNGTIAEYFGKVRADYEMSRSSRFVRHRTGVNPQGSGADYHYRNESQYYRDIEQARDMDRNDPLVGILADRRVDNVVQQGFTLEPKTGDKKLDLDLWQEWEEYSNDPDQCDIAGEMTWKDLERHVCRAEIIDGDIVVIGTPEGSFQAIEAHLIQVQGKQSGVFLGVETNSYGKRIRYHVMEEVDEFGKKEQRDPMPVRDANGVRQLFHVYDPKRVNMTRGVTMLAPIFGMSSILEDINFAKLVQQQMVSMWAILHEYAPNTPTGTPIVDGDGKTSYGESRREGSREIEGISPGMEYFGEAGETLKGFSPDVPNGEYFQQVRLIMQIMGVTCGMPLCLVLMDGSETNFSGWRGATDEARKGFIPSQVNQVNRLNTPFYRWWVNHRKQSNAALRSAEQNSKVNIFGHVWHPPTWSYIEPVADAEGDATQLRNALTSPRRLHAARGKDWETVAEEIIADNLYAIQDATKKAASFNKKYPTMPPITWRDLIPLVMPQGQTLAMQDPGIVEAHKERVEAEKND